MSHINENITFIINLIITGYQLLFYIIIYYYSLYIIIYYSLLFIINYYNYYHNYLLILL